MSARLRPATRRKRRRACTWRKMASWLPTDISTSSLPRTGDEATSVGAPSSMTLAVKGSSACLPNSARQWGSAAKPGGTGG